MKTAVTVLQELMIKMGLTPEYECIAQSGPKHQAMFDYRCVAFDVVVTASARSKKEAKQEVARLMLQQLSLRGHSIPPPFGVSILHADPSLEGAAAARAAGAGAGDARSYVALLKELCEEYRLPGAQYELVGDTGPPHLRHFTVRVRMGQHQRIATSTTKKAARQLAAEKLYSYLRENLARVTREFNEEDALMRAHEKAMDRYPEVEEQPRRPDLGQVVADYHLGLTARIEEETRERGAGALRAARAQSPGSALRAACAALRLELRAASLARRGAGPLCVLELGGSSPDLAFAAPSERRAAAAALRYLRRALCPEDIADDEEDEDEDDHNDHSESMDSSSSHLETISGC